MSACGSIPLGSAGQGEDPLAALAGVVAPFPELEFVVADPWLAGGVVSLEQPPLHNESCRRLETTERPSMCRTSGILQGHSLF
jgi:hypothetical protein